MDNKKKLNINTHNKILIEELTSREQIKESYFEHVYLRAETIIDNIIDDNRNMKDDDFERMANIVAFLGERGRGKTSAMVSFIRYMKNRDENKYKNINFISLPYIDATILIENEFILDIVLANMKDMFDQHVENTSLYCRDAKLLGEIKDIQNDFIKVRKAYLDLKKKSLNEKKELEDEMSAAGGLHDLAVSMNLKNSLENLIMRFNNIIGGNGNTYLFIPIDDLDMSAANAGNILEQIRRFLKIKNVIVTITADINQLRLICQSKHVKALSIDEEVSHKFVNDYMEKVLPSNMRIYLPELTSSNVEYEIIQDKFIQNHPYIKNCSEKSIILEFMAKNFDLYFSVDNISNHFLQNKSVRGIANYFEKLSQINCNNKLDLEIWLREDYTDRIVRRIKNYSDCKMAMQLPNVEYEDLNNRIISYINKKLIDNYVNFEDNLGNVLYKCAELVKADYENKPLVEAILYWYTIVIHNLDVNGVSTIINGSIFGNWDSRLTYQNVFKDKNLVLMDKRSSLRLDIPKNNTGKQVSVNEMVQSIVDQNIIKIRAWLYVYMFLSINDKNIYHTYINNDDDNYIELRLLGYAKRDFFNFIVNSNINVMKQMYELYSNVINSIYKEVYKIKQRSGDVEELKNNNRDKILKFRNVDEDISPINISSVHVLYYIGKNVFDKVDFESGNIYIRLSKIYKEISKELDKIDDYYKRINIDSNMKVRFNNMPQMQIFLAQNIDMLETIKLFSKYFENMCGVVVGQPTEDPFDNMF